MDDDALASTYVTKVLTCLSKWRVKMQSMREVFLMDEEETENSKQNLHFILFEALNMYKMFNKHMFHI